jgi:hypothetical protein
VNDRANSRSVRLVRFGSNVALVMPEAAWRASGLLAGMSVRVISGKGEVRIRASSTSRVYDLESLDEYRDRRAKEESDSPDRWVT